MKISYKVLWIEDNFKDASYLIEGLQDNLHDIGFQLEYDMRETLSIEEIDQLKDQYEKYNPYDMIIFDYDLGHTTGDQLAKKLRESIYTDIIFYTGKELQKLRKSLFEREVDGVFVISRTNFNDDAWPIIENQVKKICDLNNMRGIILDEMSKIDIDLRELLSKKFEALSNSEQETHVKSLKARIEKRAESQTEIFNLLSIDNFVEITNDPLKIEFNLIRQRLNKILKSQSQQTALKEDGLVYKYQSLRNKFAHNSMFYNESEGSVSLSNYENEEYDFDKFIEIRKDLINISQTIEDLLTDE